MSHSHKHCQEALDLYKIDFNHCKKTLGVLFLELEVLYLEVVNNLPSHSPFNRMCLKITKQMNFRKLWLLQWEGQAKM